MTQPAQARQNKGGGRTYAWPIEPPHEFMGPGATSCISGGVPKPGLTYWSANEVADYAVRNRVKWERLDYRDAYDLLRRIPWRNRDDKADVGTIAHAAIEAYIAGKELAVDDPKAVGYATAGITFLREWQVKILYSEATVYSRKHKYGGTCDLFAKLPHYGLAVVDFKTGKKPYPEVGLQLAAYANADFIGSPDGSEIPMPEVRVGMVVTLRSDGGYSPHIVDIGEEQFDAFLHAKAIYEWSQGNHRVVGQPLDIPAAPGEAEEKGERQRDR